LSHPFSLGEFHPFRHLYRYLDHSPRLGQSRHLSAYSSPPLIKF
jgi:hypothetical protein